MASSLKLKVSQGEDAEYIQAEIQALVDNKGWELIGDDTIRKKFHFKTYTKVLDFNNVVGVRCKSVDHHPVTTLKFSSATFEWTTHTPPGLSSKDTKMANYCEERASEIGQVLPENAPSCKGSKAKA
ncbi:hypothetical protein N7478_008017 [Penicillium angulare]|uniref:uncharacterized protein n=1 Tax=Penicillium angulare TaxID=116970 RepID=UPI002541DD24|nr:uncharacterized protein N7478_008017 [Penicillium angulare]KAJ5272892.1 hypothetical protein N7478_008017 [Penicillium angulare]